ncbi:MAG: hypothetical protein F6K11_16325 [Leptolyngbya sp. SIO3F4]|nr:hypothetical protein [Leptolyngbya sp. SIO3F4]
MNDLSQWWEGLSSLEMVYWIVAIPASIAFVIILFTTFIGGDVDGDLGDADADVGGDEGIGFQFITIKNLIGFFTVFGWIGLACIEMEVSSVYTVVISFICGLLMMTVMSTIFYFMSRLTHSGTLRLDKAIGRTGEVYLEVPAERAGFGKVQLNIQGQLRELDAMTDGNHNLDRGSIVQVVSVIDEHILLVQKSMS